MSTGDDETVTLHIGEWAAPGDEGEPEPTSRPDRAVALPAAVAVAALLIVVTVVGSSLAHKRSGEAATWVTGPAAAQSSEPSSGVSVRSQPVSPSTYTRESIAATRVVPVAPATTTATRAASSSPTAKASPSKSVSPSPTPSPSCTPKPWPHTGCKHHHN